MKQIIDFLNEARFFFVATVDGNKPKVRPFGAQIEYEGKIYFCTNRKKEVYKQLLANPNVEICGLNSQNEWVRLSGEAVMDDRVEVRRAMLKAYPSLKGMYKEDDGLFEVFYVKNPEATLFNITGSRKKIL